jgi:hypothetical protein
MKEKLFCGKQAIIASYILYKRLLLAQPLCEFVKTLRITKA